MGPDETASNRLGALFEVTGRMFNGDIYPQDTDETLSHRWQGYGSAKRTLVPRVA